MSQQSASFETVASRLPQDEEFPFVPSAGSLMLRSRRRRRLEARANGCASFSAVAGCSRNDARSARTVCVLWREPGASRPRLRARRRQHRDIARRQRRRQDDDIARIVRNGSAQRRGSLRRQVAPRSRDRRHCAPRDCPCAGGAGHLCPHDGRRKSAARRHGAARPRPAFRATSSRSMRIFRGSRSAARRPPER